ncbi:MAG: prepilin-type N-terminal cleavage/methylation domain-containing protein [Dehalococcoidia bacterium]|nr:prepilin-type N-terminal cleavage/methylation domain-containing protein [Dehalococcoidia bacterium]
MKETRTGSSQAGVTLVEVLMVLALLAVLSAMVIPNIQGFLSVGREKAHTLDRNTLQIAVDGYYRKNRAYPTTAGATGAPTSGNNSYVDTDALLAANLLNEAPASVSTYNKSTATGTYGWYVDANGRVQAAPTYTGSYP